MPTDPRTRRARRTPSPSHRRHFSARPATELLEARALLAARAISLAAPAFYGDTGNGAAGEPSISADGLRVAFTSRAANLVPGVPLNAAENVYLFDRGTGVTTLVSINRDGTAGGSGDSTAPVLSADGRFVAFRSAASDLSADRDENGTIDIYVRDLTTGTTSLVSMNASGTGGGNSFSERPSLSADGRYVAFESYATDLVAGFVDNNNGTFSSPDVYVRDLVTRSTRLVSASAVRAGSGNAGSRQAVISSDGRFVTFVSDASDLGPVDENRAGDVYVRDLTAGTTRLVSVNHLGTGSGDDESGIPPNGTLDISADGRYVAFSSIAGDLVAGFVDRNGLGTADFYVRDMQAGTTRLATADLAGTGGANGPVTSFDLTSDGRYLAFDSQATNLVAGVSGLGRANVFVRDLVGSTTRLASVAASGLAASDGDSANPRITADGRYVAFSSAAGNLVAADGNGAADVFLRDLQASQTTLVSVNAGGTAAGAGHSPPRSYYGYLGAPLALSAGGPVVAFASEATDLVAADNNAAPDVFVRAVPAEPAARAASRRAPALPAAFTGHGTSNEPSLSPDGRYVAFTSYAYDIVTNDANGFGPDVFLRDLQTGATTLVSVNAAGTGGGDRDSNSPQFSADGNFILFESRASNLLAGSTLDGFENLYLRDLRTNTTRLVTVNAAGTGGSDRNIYKASVSADGRYVAFITTATNLVTGLAIGHDDNIFGDLYVRDMQLGTTRLVSIDRTGTAGANADIYNAQISGDGRRVVFQSYASNLVAGDANGYSDIFVRDLVANTTSLVSANAAGTGSGNNGSGWGGFLGSVLSADGRFVVFTSSATDLVTGVVVGLGNENVYLRDLQAGRTELISVNAAGTGAANLGGSDASISGDGRFVAFDSFSGDLVAGGTATFPNVYVRDRQAGTTVLASVTAAGVAAGGTSDPVLSRDGRVVAFRSASAALVPGGVNDGSVYNLYARDLQAGRTVILTPAASGVGGADDNAFEPVISADGSLVAFVSDATNLDPSDTNRNADVFVAGTQPAGGRIAGRVVSDLDGDGLLEAGEPGLPGVTVFLDADRDGVLDPSEVRVLSDGSGRYAFNGLTAGAYTVAHVVPAGYARTLPAGAGSYAVTLATDADAADGRDFGDLRVRPDLVASAVAGPTSAAPGGSISVTWKVRNVGAGAAVGPWFESVFLSRDAALGPDDLLLGTVPHPGGDLAPGAEVNESGTFALAGVAPGTYYLIVQADSRARVEESDEANNQATSVATLTVAIPTLTPGVPRGDAFTAVGQERYYQVAATPGRSLLIDLRSVAAEGAVELFIKRGGLASPYDFDYRQVEAGRPNPRLVVPLAEPGTYTILARSVGGAAAAAGFTITASLPGLTIQRVSPATGGNSGPATVRIDGTDLSAGSVVTLVSGGTTIATTAIDYRDPSLLFATFDLTGRPAGTFDVRAVDGASAVVAPAAFRVVAAAAPVYTSITYTIVAPQYTRDGRVQPVTVEYTNTSSVDVPAPLITIKSDKALLGLAGAAGAMQSTVTILGISPDGPSGVLRAGQTGRAVLSMLPTTNVAHDIIGFELTAPGDPDEVIDWAAQKDRLRPAHVRPEAWDAIWANLLAIVGTTIGQYNAAVAGVATRLGSLGAATASTDELLGTLIQQADASAPLPALGGTIDAFDLVSGQDPLLFRRAFLQPISGRYRLGPLGRGWVSPWEVTLDVDPDGNVALHDGGNERAFTRLEDGTYEGTPGDHGVLTKAGSLYSLRDPGGSVRAFRADGRLDTVTDPNGNRITAGYTGDRLTSLTHSAGPALTLSYNGQGRLTRIVDSAGQAATFTYDGSGEHLLSVADPSGTISYTYAAGLGAQRAHALTSITYPDGSRQTYEYDARGRIVRQAAAGGAEALTFAYDTTGGYTVTDAAGATTRLIVGGGRIEAIVDPNGRKTAFEYDADGNLIELTSPAGTTQAFDYDAQGNRTSSTDALGNVVTRAYDPVTGWVRLLVDARGQTTRYGYDDRHNLTSITYPDGSQMRFTVDARGNPVDQTNRRGQTIHETYDARGLLTRRDYPDGSHVDYGYDARGNMTTAVDARGAIVMAYDAADRMTSIAYPGGRSLRFTYDAQGRRSRLEDQSGSAVVYRYDAVGRLAELTDGAGARIVAYAYDGLGRLARADRGDGSAATYEYDAAGQLTHLVNLAPGGAVNSRFDYTYDALGRRATMTTLDGTTTYGYDATGQLTSATLPGGRLITYEYDASGNRVRAVDSGVATAYSTNNRNEYTAAGAATFGYDADGNLTTKTDATGTTTYRYDPQGRLVRVSGPAGTWDYEYDPFGNRAAVVRDGRRTEYLYDPGQRGQLVGEYEADGDLVARYVQGLGLVTRVAPGGANYYDFDAIGSTVGLTDASGGYVNRYSYLPFGEALSAAEGVANPFTYVGQQGVESDGSGLLRMRARFYDPGTGRFVSNDPLDLLGGDPNLRRYANNNPVLYTDPSGFGYFVGQPIYGLGPNPTPDGFNSGNGTEFGHTAYITDDGHVYEFGSTGFDNGNGINTLWEFPPGAVKPGQPLIPSNNPSLFPRGKPPVILDPTRYNDDMIRKIWERDRQNTWYFIVPIGTFVGPFDATIHFDNCQSFCSRVRSDAENLINHDPNEVVGPAGVGPGNAVRPDALLPYTIFFENDEALAQVPVQDATIEQVLDPDLDLATFELGPIAFGPRTVDVPAGLASYRTSVDFRNPDGSALRVDIAAGLDLATRRVRWSFHSVDPLTGTYPVDVFSGFLPPNDVTHRGEGSVSYFVRTRPGLANGATVEAVAPIVFDTNAAILTNTHVTTVDVGPPASRVEPLPATSPASFLVRWGGVDDAGRSGIASYDLFVSIDGAAPTPWLTATTQTAAAYAGQPGHSYGFFSVATDNLGHREATPAAVQAATTVPRPPAVVQFGAAQVEANEDAGSVTIVVTRTGSLDGTAVVTLATRGGTAVPDVHYTPLNVVLSFAPGEATKVVTITVRDDGVRAGDVSVGLVLIDPGSGTVLGGSAATLLIRDTDPEPILPQPPPAVRVTGAALRTTKVKRKATTTIVVGFSDALDPAAAGFLGNYRLVAAGRDKKFGTKDDKVQPLARAAYDPAARAVTLTPRRALPKGQAIQLRALGSGLRDAAGRPIDGDGDGQAGGDAVATPRPGPVRATASTLPVLDALLGSGWLPSPRPRSRPSSGRNHAR